MKMSRLGTGTRRRLGRRYKHLSHGSRKRRLFCFKYPDTTKRGRGHRCLRVGRKKLARGEALGKEKLESWATKRVWNRAIEQSQKGKTAPDSSTISQLDQHPAWGPFSRRGGTLYLTGILQ